MDEGFPPSAGTESGPRIINKSCSVQLSMDFFSACKC